ncbi:uncharacterized protein T551_03571 [Pneumocystis jirovecii RU7]|uniref:Uncharacterized protein n=1 Tax=Pneumocystis jirovecii (strain RU7) TaxID=1408657 RepID=A0A0W4ZCY0_PNEJ7|nr:uncharacterized protein T551_03571 [Pneumocystis jirovecii RU7]KTW26272.1 hypothetical protein T551_03571 [Pneumocystis jirovecii RU7]
MDVKRFLERLERNKPKIYTADKPDLARIRANVMYARRLILREEQSGKPMWAQKQQIDAILDQIEARRAEIEAKKADIVVKDEYPVDTVDRKQEETEEILMQHQEMADAMTEKMLRLAQEMKMNAHTMGEIAERDKWVRFA